MHVAIFHNAVSADDPAADQDVLVQAGVVRSALAELGHRIDTVPCTLDLGAARARLVELAPDVVFNLVETLGSSDWMASAAAGLLDSLGVPYTGSSTEALVLTNHKLLAKHRLCQADLPTPEWMTVESSRSQGTIDPRHRGGLVSGASYMVKTVWEHASFDLGDHSVITPVDEAGLLDVLRASFRRLRRPCFAERYVEGREFNLSVLAGPDGPEVLPPAEIDFSAFPPGKPKIVGRQAKWEEASFDFQNTPRRFDLAASDEQLVGRLCQLARDTWTLFGLGGYVRVDFRVDSASQPWILEINANPCLSPDAGFAAALARASIPFSQAVERVLNDALR
jgi:D-alanine-D-alanine ligase